MSGDGEQTVPGDLDATLVSRGDAREGLGSGTETQGPGVPHDRVVTFKPGDRIDQFVVRGELGAGAMGVVLEAHDPDLDRLVAIKLVRPRPGSADTDAAHQRMLREAQSMAKITHPNVVTVHQVGFQDGQLFIAMEFVDGRTLRGWLAKQTRSLTEVLDVFSAAGQGLVAAHKVGLVHRDFKPDNVLVSHAGRVAVTDFGLVAIAGAAATQTEPGPGSELLNSSDFTLTATGLAMGSPAYMASEQHKGHDVDHRADQFAFCVALWEALYGARPFQRDTLPELVYATLEGKIPTPVRTAVEGSVPDSIEAALRRGLRPTADERWPNMESLLEALRHDPKAKTRKLAVGAAVVAGLSLVGGGVAWAVASDDEPSARPACDGGPERRAEVWNDEQRARLAAGLASTGAPLAPKATAAATRQLDDWAAAWEHEYQDACEATAHRGDQSNELLDQRMQCLERSRADVRLLVAALVETTDAQAISKVTAAASSSTKLGRCTPARLQAEDTDSIEALARAAPIREAIDAAVLLDTLGKPAESVAALEALRPKVDALGQDAVLAELLLHTGRMLARAGRAAESEPVLKDAIAKAADASANNVEAEAMLALADTVGSHLGDPKRALGVLAGAASAVRHASDPELESYYERAMGGMLYMTQQHELSEQHLRKALELDHAASDDRTRSLAGTYNVLAVLLGDLARSDEALEAHDLALKNTEAHYGPGHPNLGVIRNNRGAVYRAVERREDARRDYERALEILRDSVGDEHPWLAISHEGLGILAQEAGDLDAATEEYTKTLAIREAAYGGEHFMVASSLHNLAGVAFQSAKPLEASKLWLRARAIWVKTNGENHPSVADIDQNLGQVAVLTGDVELAQRRFKSALQISQVVYGESHPQLIIILANYAETLQGQGRCSDAVQMLERGLRIAEEHQRSKTPDAAALLSVRAWCHIAAKEFDAAAPLLERAISIHAAATGAPYQLAREHYGYARALAGQGKTEDARSAADVALEHAAAAGAQGETLATRIAEWRATLD